MLTYIPFEILLASQYPEDGSYGEKDLFGNYTVSYAASATILAECMKSPTRRISSFTGIAPNYSGTQVQALRGARSLKYNKTEIVQLGKFFRNAKLHTEGLRHDFFLEQCSDAEILHLAMHAEIDEEDPLLSSFLLGDEDAPDQRVYAYEIQSRSMSATHAVLSACNTGIGRLRKGEGVMSLARCFQYAGCPSLVVSLWPMDDLATSELMQYYYMHLKQGEDKDKALRNARLDYLQHADPATRHPFYWAGFVIIGNTDPLAISSNKRWWTWMIAVGILLAVVVLWQRRRLLHRT
jgi:CHAT domain-containing protein